MAKGINNKIEGNMITSISIDKGLRKKLGFIALMETKSVSDVISELIQKQIAILEKENIGYFPQGI